MIRVSRVSRAYGRVTGVDLAWSANGYVYHTHLDTAENVPLPALQRTGDNVLALTQGALACTQAPTATAH